MSRELKFRVWSFLSKSFEYFDIYQGANLGIAGGASEPQQFTGMLDKNGKEIYEGDYINFSYTGETIFTGFVRWFNDRASFGVTVDNAFETFEELMDYWGSVEVIGNKFEYSEDEIQN
jgi:YopX protein.